MAPEIRYVAYMPYDQTAPTCPILLEAGADVATLIQKIKIHYHFERRVKFENIHVYTCGTLDRKPPNCKDTDAERYKQAIEWLHSNKGRKMDDADFLQDHLPSGPSAHGKIDVIVATNSILESHDVLHELPECRLLKFTDEKLSQIQNLPSPSDAIASVQGIRQSNDEDTGIHFHRPVQNHGPPSALFCPIFARLKHDLDHLREERLRPTPQRMALSHAFFSLTSAIYDDEKQRMEALKGSLRQFLGTDVTWLYKVGEPKVSFVDAVWGNLPSIILELQNEPGLGGDASLRAAVSYSKIVSQGTLAPYVGRSNCPALLIGLMGPRLEISTAIVTDGIYVDKLLTLDLILAAWRADSVMRLARIMTAVGLCANELEKYYESLVLNEEPKVTFAHLFPNPVPIEGGSAIPKLEYLGKLSRQGKLIKIGRDRNPEDIREERPYALYLATLEQADDNKVDVVVKFAPQYNKEAHECLASFQAAPKVHYCAPVLGGLYMIVMDRAKGEPLYRAQIPRPKRAGILDKIRSAIRLLHEKNLVFGDLRAQNILLTQDGGVKIIDFDWVSEDSVGRYPATLSDHLPNTWAEGIERGGIMEKAHDLLMLEKLEVLLQQNLVG